MEGPDRQCFLISELPLYRDLGEDHALAAEKRGLVARQVIRKRLSIWKLSGKEVDYTA